ELNPTGFADRVLCGELATRLQQIQELSGAMAAIRCEGEAALGSVLSIDSSSPAVTRALAQASVLASPRHEALLRQQIAASAAYLRAWRHWNDAKRQEMLNS